MKAKECAQCGNTEGLLRPVPVGKSSARLWVCSDECKDAVEMQLALNYDNCTACGGEGGRFKTQFEFDKCGVCKGVGLVEKSS